MINLVQLILIATVKLPVSSSRRRVRHEEVISRCLSGISHISGGADRLVWKNSTKKVYTLKIYVF
jgi:hypothetical protein